MTESAVESVPDNVTSLPQFTEPEFNQADFVVNDLSEQVAAQAKTIAVLKSNIAQLTGILKANAGLLGLVEDENGNMSPAPTKAAPNRATRRARTPKK